MENNSYESKEKLDLTINLLCKEAFVFSEKESVHNETSIYGVTDGKAIGTYLEHKFKRYLNSKFKYAKGNSARGIDFPVLNVDLKVTSIKQPQSSCPYKSARQKIYGLGYSLLVFIYDKIDDDNNKTGNLNILHTIFVESYRTADFQTTTGLNNIINNDGNLDDISSFIIERNLPVDDIQLNQLSNEIINNPPQIGYLTISNALQWRLQYTRLIQFAGKETGIVRIK